MQTPAWVLSNTLTSVRRRRAKNPCDKGDNRAINVQRRDIVAICHIIGVVMASNSYRLRKWRRLLLLRESREVTPGGPRLCVCVLCGTDVFHKTGGMQAHHVRPKALYPDEQYNLDNGVLLCAAHHQGMVHNGNASVDMTASTWTTGWKSWLVHFERWNDMVENVKFNKENQSRI